MKRTSALCWALFICTFILFGVTGCSEIREAIGRAVLAPVHALLFVLEPLEILTEQAYEMGDTEREAELQKLRDEVTAHCRSFREMHLYATEKTKEQYGEAAFRDAKRCKKTLKKVRSEVEEADIPDYTKDIFPE